MNIREIPLCNGANLAMFMANVSKVLLTCLGEERITSVLDLKSKYHGLCYMQQALKVFGKNDDPIFNSSLLARMTALGRIHPLEVAA